MFKFQEGQSVAIREDHPALGLKAGNTGVVWALYTLEPPLYEVTFRNADGREFDITMTEEELLAVGQSTPKSARRSASDRSRQHDVTMPAGEANDTKSGTDEFKATAIRIEKLNGHAAREPATTGRE